SSECFDLPGVAPKDYGQKACFNHPFPMPSMAVYRVWNFSRLRKRSCAGCVAVARALVN
ncbi:hypothetical protein KI387_003329, partial [Taxus chinensis]